MTEPQLDLFPDPSKARSQGRKRPDGIATTNVTLSASVGDNAPVFRDIVRLFV